MIDAHNVEPDYFGILMATNGVGIVTGKRKKRKNGGATMCETLRTTEEKVSYWLLYKDGTMDPLASMWSREPAKELFVVGGCHWRKVGEREMGPEDVYREGGKG
jgi:hypothetical protein